MELPMQLALRVGKIAELRLRGFRAAGYQWQYAIKGPGDVVSVSLEMAGPEPGSEEAGTILGVSRDEQAGAQALRPGYVTIDFTLRRPWELDKPPLQEHRLEVSVEPQ